MHQFDTNYIIFKNVEILFQNFFAFENKIKFDEIFENISFVKMESSKIIIYSTNMCRSYQGINYNTLLPNGGETN